MFNNEDTWGEVDDIMKIKPAYVKINDINYPCHMPETQDQLQGFADYVIMISKIKIPIKNKEV